MNWWRLVFLLSAIICRGACAADLTQWLDAAQDSTGLVWGVPLTGKASAFVHNGSEWKQVFWAPEAGMTRPVAIASGPDGMVRIIWQGTKADSYWLTQHRGSNSAIAGQFPAKFEGPEFKEPFLFIDSKGTSWITHKGPSILRADLNRRVEEAYVIPNDLLVNQQDENGRKCFFQAPRVLQDGRGHLWFWMDGRSNNVMRLDGFIEFDGSNFVHRRFSLIPPDARCYLLVPEDQNHLLAAFRKEGVFRIDLNNFTATRIESPAPGAFGDVLQMFRANGADYIVTFGYSSHQENNTLWRWQPGQPVEKIATGLGRFPSSRVPFLQLPNGLIFGAAGRGLMFVPWSGPPQVLDWASGVAARAPARIFGTLRNNLLVVSGREGSDVAALPPWSKPIQSAALGEIQTKRGYARDSRGRVWAIDLPAEQIQQWDGKQWTAIPVLPGMKWFESIMVDSHDRVWIIGRDHGPYVWDPAANAWRQWQKDLDAIEYYVREDPKFAVGHDGVWRVVSSGDGRILRRYGSVGSLDYFDGKSWLRWRHGEIPSGYPRFEPSGKALLVDVDKVSEFSGNQWVPVAGDRYQVSRPLTKGVGGEDVVGRKDGQNVVQDQTGALWWTSNHQLYVTRKNATSPLFKNGEVNPFLDGRGLMDVVVDCDGNVFLQTNAAADDWVFLRAGSLPR